MRGSAMASDAVVGIVRGRWSQAVPAALLGACADVGVDAIELIDVDVEAAGIAPPIERHIGPPREAVDISHHDLDASRPAGVTARPDPADDAVAAP